MWNAIRVTLESLTYVYYVAKTAMSLCAGDWVVKLMVRAPVRVLIRHLCNGAHTMDLGLFRPVTGLWSFVNKICVTPCVFSGNAHYKVILGKC